MIKDKLQSFKFDDNGEPGLLRQQLQDYNKLRDQLKAAVQVQNPSKNRTLTFQSEKLSRQISEVTAKTKPATASYTTINDFDKKIEPLLIITPQPTLNRPGYTNFRILSQESETHFQIACHSTSL